MTILLAAWAGLYLSSLWQPIGYVLAAVVVVAAVLMMIVYGQWERPVAWATYPLAGGFLLLVVYLFVSEEQPTDESDVQSEAESEDRPEHHVEEQPEDQLS